MDDDFSCLDMVIKECLEWSVSDDDIRTILGGNTRCDIWGRIVVEETICLEFNDKMFL